MKNLKLTQSLNQNVGIEIEETGLRPGTLGAQLAGRGPWHAGIAKFVKLRICSVNYGIFWGALLGKGGPNFLIPPPQSYTGWHGPVSLYYNN